MTHRDNGLGASAGIRDVSAARCAIALRDGGESTITGVAGRTGLSRPTVEAGIAAMVERGLVVDTDGHTTGGRGVGRPARLYAFNAGAGHVIGVDVGSHRIRAAIADLSGRVVGWAEERMGADLSGTTRLSTVADFVRRALGSAGLSPARLVAMTVAVTGMVDTNGRLIASDALRDWEGVDVAGHLRAEFDCTVIVENDMRLAALAEHRLGAAQLMDDVLFFFAGHRLSLGLVIGGELRRGRHSAAGEIGGLAFNDLISPDGDVAWASAPSGREVFRRALAGDRESKAEVDRFVEALASGIALMTMTIDPDIVVIGGGLSTAGDVLLDPLRRSIAARINVPVRPSIKASELGAESVVLGALALASGNAAAITLGVRGLPEPTIDAAQARTVAEEGTRG